MDGSIDGSDAKEDDFLASLCYGDESADGGRDSASNAPETEKSNAWLLFLHLIVAPRLGWRRIKSAKFAIDDYSRTLFYPLLALMAACRFIDKVYYADARTGPLLQQAVATFVAGFAGYFLIMLLARAFLPTVARMKIDTGFGKVYVMTVLSVLTLAVTLGELVPWLGMLLLVPPIYAMYILVKGIKPLRVPDAERTPTAILMVVLCLGVPSGIYFLLEMMMPPA